VSHELIPKPREDENPWSSLPVPHNKNNSHPKAEQSFQIGARLLHPGDNFLKLWATLWVPPLMRSTRPHLWLNCLCIHLSHAPNSFVYLNLYSSCLYPKDGKDELSAYSASSHRCTKPCNQSPFFAFTMPLYLAFRGGWLDLAYGISGVWALVQNTSFSWYLFTVSEG
jgi:hypothetical protein